MFVQFLIILVLSNRLSSAYNDDLYLYGGVSQEGTYTCAEGLYIFRTSMS